MSNGVQDVDRIYEELMNLQVQNVLSRSVAGWVYVQRDTGVWWMTESEFKVRLRNDDWNP